MNKRIVDNILHTDRGRCVAVVKHNGTYYYALSGNDDPYDANLNDIAHEIEMMIGAKRTVRCFIKDTYTVFRNFNYPDLILPTLGIDEPNFYKELEKFLYKNLYKSTNDKHKLQYLFPELENEPISYMEYVNKKIVFSDRFFSCVERKIMGKLNTNFVHIYVHQRPCYLCIPSIRFATYYDGHKVYNLEVLKADCFKSYLMKSKRI